MRAKPSDGNSLKKVWVPGTEMFRMPATVGLWAYAQVLRIEIFGKNIFLWMKESKKEREKSTNSILSTTHPHIHTPPW
jgi:hypothetical protein